MPYMNVNPTRMELTRLKRQLSIAARGHKLLKDKQDEMIRQFMLIIRKTRAIREEIEQELVLINKEFMNARLKTNYEGIMEALMIPSKEAKIKVQSKTIMNMKVPSVEYVDSDYVDLTYGFAFTPSELDEAILRLTKLLPKMIQLAELEKSCDMLADEIEKTRRN